MISFTKYGLWSPCSYDLEPHFHVNTLLGHFLNACLASSWKDKLDQSNRLQRQDVCTERCKWNEGKKRSVTSFSNLQQSFSQTWNIILLKTGFQYITNQQQSKATRKSSIWAFLKETQNSYHSSELKSNILNHLNENILFITMLSWLQSTQTHLWCFQTSVGMLICLHLLSIFHGANYYFSNSVGTGKQTSRRMVDLLCGL